MKGGWENRWEATVEEYIQKRTTRAANGCLLWKGAKPGRVGWFQYKGMFKSTSAPICVYTVRFGPIKKDRILRHTCDDPRCVEIRHLIPGTKKENRRDFMERHPMAMELCLAAAKIAAIGVKKKWDTMTPEQRVKFIKMRAEAQKKKYPKGHPMHHRRALSVQESKRRNRESLTT